MASCSPVVRRLALPRRPPPGLAIAARDFYHNVYPLSATRDSSFPPAGIRNVRYDGSPTFCSAFQCDSTTQSCFTPRNAFNLHPTHREELSEEVKVASDASSSSLHERKNLIKTRLLYLLYCRGDSRMSFRSVGNDEQIRHWCRGLKLLYVIGSFPSLFDIVTEKENRHFVQLRRDNHLTGGNRFLPHDLTFRSLKALLKWGSDATKRNSVSSANSIRIPGITGTGSSDNFFSTYDEAVSFLRKRRLITHDVRRAMQPANCRPSMLPILHIREEDLDLQGIGDSSFDCYLPVDLSPMSCPTPFSSDMFSEMNPLDHFLPDAQTCRARQRSCEDQEWSFFGVAASGQYVDARRLSDIWDSYMSTMTPTDSETVAPSPSPSCPSQKLCERETFKTNSPIGLCASLPIPCRRGPPYGAEVLVIPAELDARPVAPCDTGVAIATKTPRASANLRRVRFTLPTTVPSRSESFVEDMGDVSNDAGEIVINVSDSFL